MYIQYMHIGRLYMPIVQLSRSLMYLVLLESVDVYVKANPHMLHPPTQLIIRWEIWRYRYIFHRIFKAGGEKIKSKKIQTHS